MFYYFICPTFILCYHKNMLNRIKNKIDSQLEVFLERVNKDYSLGKLSPLISKSIKDFVLRDGKRIRPILFVIGYSSLCSRKAKNLYESALAIELLHDFMLIHDDIIDKSDTRRGKPSMHKMLEGILKKHKNIKFNGQDLAIVIGDVLYAIAIDAFLSIKEEPKRKEVALKNFIKAAICTGSGEFIELLGGIKSIDEIKKSDIYKIYDYKTAFYTFACPLSTGAILAGASQSEITKLSQYGMQVGRAFQIKDDIIGIFGDEKKIGKSTLSDLQEAKKTILIWHAYNNSKAKDKKTIKAILSKGKVTKSDLAAIQKIIIESGSLDFSRNEINKLIKNATDLIQSSKMRKNYQVFLRSYPKKSLLP